MHQYKITITKTDYHREFISDSDNDLSEKDMKMFLTNFRRRFESDYEGNKDDLKSLNYSIVKIK